MLQKIAAVATILAFLLGLVGFFSGWFEKRLETRILAQLNGVFAGAYRCEKTANGKPAVSNSPESIGVFKINITANKHNEGIEITGTYRAYRDTPWIKKFKKITVVKDGFVIALPESAEFFKVEIPFFGNAKMTNQNSNNGSRWVKFEKVPEI